MAASNTMGVEQLGTDVYALPIGRGVDGGGSWAGPDYSQRTLSGTQEDNTTRLVIGGLALDGPPEPAVTAMAVEPTRDIVEPTPVPVTPLPVSDASAAIDRFLAGSSLAGMGNVFVAAATEYGIDPRLMPAIALWESSKCAFQAAAFNCWGLTSGADAQGRLIFRPFGSYEEGIYAVTRTYAGYGVGDHAALCRWVSGKDNCTSDYPAKVLATVEGIR